MNGRPGGEPKRPRRFQVVSSGELEEVQSTIGIAFRDPYLLGSAFVHRSYLNESPSREGLESNERIEFLGDAVLELAVTQYLYRNHPDLAEGRMTALRAALVNTNMLARVAEHLKLAQSLRMSKGEMRALQAYGRSRSRILACTLEALIGAIFLDRGIGTVELFLDQFLLARLSEVVEQGLYLDAKSVLQEVAQDRLQITPRYEVLREQGPDHDRSFWVGAYLENRLVGQGKGASKSEAAQAAAANALQQEFQITLTESAV